MPDVKTFIDWLSYHPSLDEIVKALTTDYLVGFGIDKIYFSEVSIDKSAHNLDFIPSTQEKWSPSSQTFVYIMRDHGLIQGYLIIEFSAPIPEEKKQAAITTIEEYCSLVTLFLSLQNQKKLSSNFGAILFDDYRTNKAIELSARQLLIVAGMIEGKTNHELAVELGFSTSTVRHETMRIYNALAVSDRKEAAKKAVALNLI